MKKTVVIGSIMISSWSINTHSAPNDIFLSAIPEKKPLRIEVAIDAVNDKIDVFNINKNNSKYENAGDYKGAHTIVQYKILDEVDLETGFWRREIDYANDTNKINTWLISSTYKPDILFNSSDYLNIRLSSWGNYTDQINKTSNTKFNNYRFNNLQVNNPSDLQFQLDGIFSKQINNNSTINAYIGTGYSKVKVDDLNAQTIYQGCLMNLHVNGDNSFTGQLARPCKLKDITLNTLQISGAASNFNVDIQKDLNYSAIFANFGTSWIMQHDKFQTQLAYQYQKLWRDKVDTRVSSYGNNAIKDNHTFAAKISYDIYPNITAFIEAQFSLYNFVGTIPFLYNGITASSLDRQYGYSTFGLNFKF